MLRRADLEVVHAPVMRTVPVPEDGHLRVVTEAIIADPPDYLVANTGLGMRSWWGLVTGWGRHDALFAALDGHTRIAARGPKAVGATRIIGLEIWQRAPDEQLATVGRQLVAAGIDGRRVAVQLHGDDSQELTETLPRRGGGGHRVAHLPVVTSVRRPPRLGPDRGLLPRVDRRRHLHRRPAGPQPGGVGPLGRPGRRVGLGGRP